MKGKGQAICPAKALSKLLILDIDMATSFADLQIDRYSSTDEYISSIKSDIKRNMVTALFNTAFPVFNPIRFYYKPDAQFPIIKICNDPAIGAECMEGRIEINSGLIDYCFSIRYIDTKTAIDIDTSFAPMLIPAVIFTWFYAHECFHIVREHPLLSELEVNDIALMKSTERDADSCAIAAIYRIVQEFHHQRFTDEEIRKLIVYCMFWALRELTDTPQITHSQPDERLLHITMKMAIIGISPYDEVDQSLQKQETKDIRNKLLRVTRDSELLFQELNPDALKNFNPIQRLFEKSDLSTVTRWDQVCIDHPRYEGRTG